MWQTECNRNTDPNKHRRLLSSTITQALTSFVVVYKSMYQSHSERLTVLKIHSFSNRVSYSVNNKIHITYNRVSLLLKRERNHRSLSYKSQNNKRSNTRDYGVETSETCYLHNSLGPFAIGMSTFITTATRMRPKPFCRKNTRNCWLLLLAWYFYFYKYMGQAT